LQEGLAPLNIIGEIILRSPLWAFFMHQKQQLQIACFLQLLEEFLKSACKPHSLALPVQNTIA